LYNLDDTIVAISTAGGAAARGIIRLSGPEALALAEQFFRTDSPEIGLTDQSDWRRVHGYCRLDMGIECEAKAYVFHGPRSYTGQDVVELHLPGSPVLLGMISEGLLCAGARSAEPGEFTARAFFTGRLDLTEAEAVAQVIGAQSDAQLRAAQRLLDGALHRACGAISARIADVLALVEAQLDFSQEDIELARPSQLLADTRRARQELLTVLAESTSWDQLEQLPRVVLAGPANAGKSCLANALLRMDRSIVSQIAGTTRDLLTAPLALEKGECLLIDTAGLGPVSDPLANTTQRFTRRAMGQCDLLVWVFDAGVTEPADATDLAEAVPEAARRNVILAANKVDLCSEDRTAVDRAGGNWRRYLNTDAKLITVSALRGDNIEELREMIEAAVHLDATDSAGQATLALTARQREAMRQAVLYMENAARLFSDDPDEPPGELIAVELRSALDELGSISGGVVTEDLLDRIFSRFCIGK